MGETRIWIRMKKKLPVPCNVILCPKRERGVFQTGEDQDKFIQKEENVLIIPTLRQHSASGHICLTSGGEIAQRGEESSSPKSRKSSSVAPFRPGYIVRLPQTNTLRRRHYQLPIFSSAKTHAPEPAKI